MVLQDLVHGLDTVTAAGRTDIEITGISVDSRRISPGELFCAVRGSAADGRSFINDAISRGAAAVLTDDRSIETVQCPHIVVSDMKAALIAVGHRYYGDPSRALTAVGITGTNGKTTTAFLIRAFFEAAGKPCGLIGTVGYYIGQKQYPAPNTTPGPIDIARLLAEFRDAGAGAAVMEVSSHALDQKRADGVAFDVAVFTNLTRDHLDYHKDIPHYFAAKARLFSLLNGSPKEHKAAVINIDDPYSKALGPHIATRTITYGFGAGADVRATGCSCRADGSVFDLEAGGRTFRITTHLIGRFNVSNILAAVAAGCGAGLSLDAMAAAAASFMPPPGRMQFVRCCPPDVTVIVDYAHTDDALKNVLTTVRGVTAGRLILVFGCGGDRDRTKRPLMGRIASELSDLAIVTSDNPRSEDPRSIIQDIMKGIPQESRTKMREIPDRKAAICHALDASRAGDVIIIAGKGHEDYQIAGDTVQHFSDAEEVRGYYAARGDITAIAKAPRTEGR
ncbi:MAG TPA: UDP-N-acetylmuramoyl-L-alanyl-D-glutamate--2,6-diaminopimelate ligase [bacterium]|nr:UDP-N-acetylmuramoyl-L-alanyl-D-glutamate--2,6-diaminopimelate ligase [bacterium]